MNRLENRSAIEQHPRTRSSETDEDQIAERLAWTPKERLEYLLDMLAFEERARKAKRVG